MISRSPFFLPWVCLWFFSWSQIFDFQLPLFEKVKFLHVLFLLIVADITQSHFWQFFPGCKEGLLFFVLIETMCSMFSWCFSLQKLPFPRNWHQIRNNFWRSPASSKTDIVFISIYRCCLVLCKAEMK